jgi:anthranilate/para-aminobenzoate synthase component II
MSEFKFVVIGGGKYDLNLNEFTENLKLSANIDVIKYCEINNIPLFGLGLGCQLIAFLYGMNIEKANQPHIGPNYINLDDVKKSNILDDVFTKNFNWESITKAFSYNVNVMKDTENSDIEVLIKTHENIPYVIKHKKHAIYGIQSHPDIDSMTGVIFLNSLKIKTKMARELLDNNENYLNISEKFVNELIDAFFEHNKIKK